MTYTVRAHNPATSETVIKTVSDIDSIEAAIVAVRVDLPTGFRLVSISRPVVLPDTKKVS